MCFFVILFISSSAIWYSSLHKQKLTYSLSLSSYSDGIEKKIETYSLKNTFQENNLSIDLSFNEEPFDYAILVFSINCSFDFIEINDTGKHFSVPIIIVTSTLFIVIKVVNYGYR